ncbi:MAG: glutamate 5-kinase, partial [Bacillota bacterium]|nr:glutamate 5-kinase [Bacillota bacterium]
DDHIKAIAGGVGTELGSGGMRSKVEAAIIAGDSGIPLVITDGKNVEQLRNIFRGDDNCTIFYPHKNGLRHKDRWIAHGSSVGGGVVADAGALAALHRGKSLLPVGITDVKGRFDCGDVIAVYNGKGQEIARGIANYSSQEASMIQGKKCSDENDVYELIHCDNLVIKD